jgi:hypothetical protein
VSRARSELVQRPWWQWGIEGGEERDPRSIVVRGGGALVIEGADHLPVHVSVDHAGEAADVLNALVARARASA